MNKHINAWWAVICLCLILLGGGHAMAAVEANRAPVEDLVAIKGIGPATSRKIVEARQERPFSDWPDFIQRVRGVGPATAARMSANGLTVNGRFLESSPGPSADMPLWQPMVPRPLESRR